MEPHKSTEIEISYQATSLKGVNYRVGAQNGNTIKQLSVRFHRQDLDTVRLESADGARFAIGDSEVWERKEFLAPDHFSASIVENRSLFGSLTQLLEIGPVVSLLFLLAVTAGLFTRGPMTPFQIFTVAAGYGLYYPLILYLSTRFSFVMALIVAAAVPGALLMNYARWQWGARIGLVAGPVILALYWIFPTLAAFTGWNRGLVLLCLGVVTLWVLVNLQNQALRRRVPATATPAAASAAAVLLLLVTLAPNRASATEVQVLLPAELAGKLSGTNSTPEPGLMAFDPVEYRIQEMQNYFQVDIRAGFRCLRPGEASAPLFNLPVFLMKSQVEFAEQGMAGIVNVDRKPKLFVQRPGPCVMTLSYRVPVRLREGRRRVEIPLLAGLAGTARLQCTNIALEFLSGTLWTSVKTGKATFYDVGIAGEDSLVAEWPEQGTSPLAGEKSVAGQLYGIGLTRAQNLTVIGSDGSCTHFSEFELPASQAEEFRMKLPSGARLISVSIDGSEIKSPTVEDQICRARMPERQGPQSAHRVSCRMAYPMMHLGFSGTADLNLPEVYQTAGTIEWVIALPDGFTTQIVSSGLEVQKSPPDLDKFGDYGRILKTHANIYLAKDLAPPGPMGLALKYRQQIPEPTEPQTPEARRGGSYSSIR